MKENNKSILGVHNDVGSNNSTLATPTEASHTGGTNSPTSHVGSDLGPLSPDTVDRIFPIRSVVGINSSISIEGGSKAGSRRRRSIRTEHLDNGSDYGLLGVKGSRTEGNSTAGTAIPDLQNETPLQSATSEFMTTRFKHKITDEGHMVLTGVHGAERIQKCEDEPIATPGAVQGFGVIIALRELIDETLIVRIASENSKAILGYTPAELFRLRDFCDILSEEQVEHFLDHIDFVKEDQDRVNSGPEVFSLNVIAPDSTEIKLWCAVHIAEKNPDLIICEFELEDDQLFPLFAQSEEPQDPADTLQSNPTDDEFAESTKSLSKPLRVLRHARKKRGEAAAMSVYNLMSQIQNQLESASNLKTFLKVLVGIVKELTGFHRIMIYQFDEVWNGKVVTELVDPRITKDLYKGLHFPATDIPAQARQLYKVNKVRVLYDRELPTARLVCRSLDDLTEPLDMTHAYLRAMSPIHLKYLANMAVRASMSISITAFNELWGLISCHAYGKKGMRVSFPIRKMCRLIGETSSRSIERLSYASRLQARKLINTVPTEQNPSGYIVASSDDLLKLFDADFGLLSISDETKILGSLTDSQEALALLEYFRMKAYAHVVTSQEITVNFPDLVYPPGFSHIAGLLLVPLSVEGSDFIVFFRKGQLKNVHWAGNPYEKRVKEGTVALLEPRASFKIWSETVVGKSREWTEEQIETASVLCLVYGKFIEVWRQKEAALQSSQLTKILLANASHEVRTPLNAIINYLEIALQGPLDRETRENLSRSHSASKSLIYVINDLLDLTRAEAGHNLIKDEDFDLTSTVNSVLDIYQADAARKGLSFEVMRCPDFPTIVRGDDSKTRQCVSNIMTNAIGHTNTGGIRVDMWVNRITESRCEVEIVVQDTGEGMTQKQLDTLFRELEQVQTDDESLADNDSSALAKAPGQPGQKMLGLGLAVVARNVRNMGGHLRLKSEEGKGSRFTLQIPFTLPQRSQDRIAPPVPRSHDDASGGAEVTLVNSSRNLTAGKRSMDSLNSLKSAQSGDSEIDRLVQAIQQKPRSQSEDSLRKRTPSVPEPELVESSGVSVKPVKMSDAEVASADAALAGFVGHEPSKGAVPQRPQVQKRKPSINTKLPRENSENPFMVLVAEDDPINSRIMKKRLEMMGHSVVLTGNGEQCADVFMKQGDEFDVVLMDMQMPIMDGGTSTTRIRSFENSRQYIRIPPKHNPNGRIAVFAVSATLIEAKRVEYMETGFDGWILKPVDFKRLDTMMRGIGDFEVRRQVAYAPGSWEKGGWFTTGVREEGGQSKRLNSTKDVDIQARKCSPPGEWLSEAWGDGTMERSEQEKSPNGEDINEHGRPKI